MKIISREIEIEIGEKRERYDRTNEALTHLECKKKRYGYEDMKEKCTTYVTFQNQMGNGLAFFEDK